MKMTNENMKKFFEVKDFFDNNGDIRFSLLNDEGEKNVKELAKGMKDGIFDPDLKDKGKPKKHSSQLNLNQIRKFYDAFLNIYTAKEISMKERKVRLLMLKSNAEYSANRLKVKTLEIFMKNRLDIVLKQEDETFNKYLKAFKLHFEALVGYFPKN